MKKNINHLEIAHRYHLNPEFYYAILCECLKKYSEDPKKPVSALIVDSNQKYIIGKGTNSFPFKLTPQDIEILRSNNFKNYLRTTICHAERTAISYAIQNGFANRLKNSTIYVSYTPCIDCFNQIAQSRIKKIIDIGPNPNFDKPNWGKDWKYIIEEASKRCNITYKKLPQISQEEYSYWINKLQEYIQYEAVKSL